MRWLRDFLFGAPVGPLWRYCLVALPVALIPSIALAVAAWWVLTLLEVDIASISPPHREITIGRFFGTVVFAPLIETLLLAGGLRALSLLTNKPFLIAATSAAVWGCGHALFGATWFFGTVWAFFTFSCGYLVWSKASFDKGFIAAAAPHALGNFLVLLFLYVQQA
jgi:membrane protease YdiL (CAAX protease family)